MGPSRSCWNGATSALLPDGEFHECPYKKSLETYLMILITSFEPMFYFHETLN